MGVRSRDQTRTTPSFPPVTNKPAASVARVTAPACARSIVKEEDGESPSPPPGRVPITRSPSSQPATTRDGASEPPPMKHVAVADPATHGPDHAFDRWAVAPGSKSAYCGSLWLAALRACAAIAASLGETRAVASLDAAGARAARALNDALWVEPPGGTAATGSRRVELDSNSRIENREHVKHVNGRVTAGYFRHDESGGALGNASSAAQVVGEWALATLGLAPAHPPARTREALETVLRTNARDGATFPANAADVSFLMSEIENGSESDSESDSETETRRRRARHQAVVGANLHSGERWPALAYVVAAHAVLVTDAALATDASVSEVTVTETERDDADRALVRKAWASARAAYDATWTRGLAFRAPEAMDDEGRFRGAADLKNGAVWALDRALVQKAREAESRERQRKGRGEGDFLGSDVSETRDEL